MTRALDIGLWRSTLGDTWPHRGADVDYDWHPQSTHLVWEAPALVMCASAGGNRDDEPMMKPHLDPMLAAARDRWLDRATVASAVTTMLDQWFGEVAAGFAAIDEPLYQVEWMATGVALLIRDDGAAIGNVGLDRAWRRRGGNLEAITRDVGERVPDLGIATGSADIAAAHLAMIRRRQTGEPFPTRVAPTALMHAARRTAWEIEALDVRAGDVIVLASGIAETGLGAPYLAAVIESLFADEDRLAGAQDLATRLGEAAIRDRPADKRRAAEWNVHSRLALAVVWVD